MSDVGAWPEGWEQAWTRLDKVPPEEPAWVVAGWLPIGLTVIGGPSRMYKTTLTTKLASAVATGSKGVSFSGPVLLLCGEQSPRSLKMKNPHLKGPVLIAKYPAYWKLDQQRPLGELLEAITTFDARLIVVDPLVRFHLGDEQDQRTFHKFGEPLQELAHERGISVCFVHHTRKGQPGGDMTADDLRGASALRNMADGVIMFKRKTPDDARIVISRDFRDHESNEIEWDPKMDPMAVEAAQWPGGP